MSQLKVQGDANGTGSVTIAAPNTNSIRTLTLPDQTGSVMATGGGAINVSTSAAANSVAVDSSGNVGIGTSSPGAKLSVQDSVSFLANFNSTNVNAGYIQFQSSGTAFGYVGSGASLSNSNATDFTIRCANALTFAVGSGSETARFTTSGNLLVGTTDANISSGAGVKILLNNGASTVSTASTNSNTCNHMYSTGAGAYRFYVGWGGTVYATSTTISAISDIRYKENIRDLNVGLAEVMALKPRLYDWKEGKGADIKNARGFIAQEFEKVFPDLIDEWKDEAPEGEEPYKSVRQDLIPVLVKAIQEQQALITQLQADVAALKGA